ncbi:MAG: Gfo/Idh/MocA family oxidoreductase [Anaerolineae bacterium]|nr:Gfo/Idh/MocA family oxidoreductase [Anaerolineae bacterium]MDW8099791.1 Gfo/Idh/MocA family oxidoreductase [Anaerolineae bacterium]
MRRVSLGIIGCGVIGQHHLRAALSSPLIDVVAIADLRQEAREETAARYNISKVYAEGKELIEDPCVEAVVLALPTCGRTELALHAFARGKHVLTEKPVAMNADEVRRMIAARGDLIAGCCSSRYRFLPSAKVVTDFIATGALGELRVIRARVIDAASEPPKTPPPPWRLSKALNGGGILMNWGCYDLDYLLGITGWQLRPRLVLGQTWTVAPHLAARAAPGSDAESHVAALILCDGGAVITYERGEFVAAQSESAWQIIGSRGSLRLHMLPGAGKTITYDATTSEQGVIPRVLWQGEEDADRVHTGPVQDFAAAILEGRPPMTTLEQALMIQQITDAVYASAAAGTAIEVG